MSDVGKTAFALLLFASMSRATATPSIIIAAPQAVIGQIHADHGHVVLVNFWATWCPPCVAEYPSLVSLDKQFRKRGLDVIAVSLDFGDDAPSKVKTFVGRTGAQFPQYILQVVDPETAIDSFDKNWQGDLPRTFVYGRDGKLVKTLPGPQPMSVFKAVVSKALTGQ